MCYIEGTMDIKRFKKLRKKNGYTQKSLGEALDVSPSTVAMWERGDRDPDTSTLARICDLLRCSADYLLGRTKYENTVMLEDNELPPTLRGKDIHLEVIEEVKNSGLTEKEIEKILRLYRVYSKYYGDDDK